MYTLTGPPGCGKTTQMDFLKEQGYTAIAIGILLRSQAPADILQQVEQGQMADNDYVNNLIAQALQQPLQHNQNEQIILDGYPRTAVQARWLVQHYPQLLKCCLWLKVPDDVLLQRLKQRGRADDEEVAVRQRLQIYWQNIEPLLEFYRSVQIEVIEIDGAQSVETVADALRRALVD